MKALSYIWKFGCFETFSYYNPDASSTTLAIVGISCLMLAMISAYLLGSINFAIVLSKIHGEDIREHGSQNAGTTNMLRTYGKKAAVLTLIGDFLKGTVSVIIGMLLFGMIGQYLAALFAVLGHVFPIYYKFKGGKGIATAAGTILACEPLILLMLVIIFVIIVAFTKYVSLASITVALLYPLILDRFYKLEGIPSGIHITFVLILSCIVLFKHYPNMVRLFNKTESKISFKKKAAQTEDAVKKESPKSPHNDD